MEGKLQSFEKYNLDTFVFLLFYHLERIFTITINSMSSIVSGTFQIFKGHTILSPEALLCLTDNANTNLSVILLKGIGANKGKHRGREIAWR